MNETSLFRLFGSKSELFYSTVKTLTVSVADMQINAEELYSDFSNDLDILISEYMRLYLRQMAIYRLFQIQVLHDPAINKEIYAKIETLIRHFELFLSRSHEYGLIRDADYTTLAGMFFSNLLFSALVLTSDASTLPDENEVRQHKEDMRDFLIRYLVSDGGKA